MGGAPVGAQVGGLTQGFPFTVNAGGGQNFGTKSIGIASLIRDIGADAPLGSVSSQWQQFAPGAGVGATFMLQNRATPFQATANSLIPAPHPYVSAILGGSYNGPLGGLDAYVMKQLPAIASSIPYVIYSSWYECCNPDFVFNLNTPADNNLKMDAYGTGATYTVGPNLYTAFIVSNWGGIVSLTPGTTTTIVADVSMTNGQFTNGITGPASGVRVYNFSVASGLSSLNGVDFNVTAVSGGGANPWTYTTDLNSNGLPSYTRAGAWTQGEPLVSQVGPSKNSLNQVTMTVSNSSMGWVFPDQNGHPGVFWAPGEHIPQNATTGVNGGLWKKHEVWYKASTVAASKAAGGGWYQRITDGTSSILYVGPTDTSGSSSSADRYMLLGGFTRNATAPVGTNWRFLADIMMDFTASNNGAIDVAKVYVSSSPSGRVAGAIYEPQVVPSANWFPFQITVPSFWKGALASNSTGYAFVETEGGSSFSVGSYHIN